ncbi:MAG: hypothetical protein IJW16_03950 [Clostridia bacterium]|nr:hypothetical protein [Clostridia bacterium]
MKKFNKIISAFLAVLMVLGAFSGMSISVSADDEEVSANDVSIYITQIYNTPEDKFESMTMPFVKDGYEMRVNPLTGEVAVKELATGNILFTNPYDVGNSKADDDSESTEHLLSQILVNAKSTSGEIIKLYSFADAAALGQLTATKIESGIRVDYSIGEEATRKLVPYRITDTRYQEYILGPIEKAYEEGIISFTEYEYFTYGDGSDGVYFTRQSLSFLKDSDKEEYLEKMPILATTDLWQIAPSLEKAIIDQIEAVIKKCCPDYSFDMMDEDHAETGYKAVETAYPLFKMALEYSVDADGLTVRMPCNGLRYDMNNFTLQSIQILPYIGAGHNTNDGYTFFPDGAGAIFDFDDVKAAGASFGQPVYGIDYAYHAIHEIRNQTPVRYPVYGVVANEKIYSYTYSYVDKTTGATVKVSDEASNTTIEAIRAKARGLGSVDFTVSEQPADAYSRGFVAIIEEGDSLAQIATYHAGVESEYNTILTTFNPRPSDEYDLADSISVSGDTMFTVVSNRKYTGAVSIRYKMLTDKSRAADVVAKDPSYVTYDTTWLGMAEFYRDYLIRKGTLTKLEANDVEADIPLYLEVFGAMETQQTIMTLPVQVMTPLTTFENIVTMYNELSKEGVNNINFKMTGFANGGIYSTVPSDLEWEDAVGGEDGFKELVRIANEINAANDNRHLGIYPDFDFAYISDNTLFDNTYLNDDAVKTIDNRYTSKRVYSATQQKYISFYQLAVSPSRYDKFYTELMENYGEYDVSGISLASLGNALNSDFDEDDPYNREDSKKHTVDALNAIKNANGKQYDVMLDSANAYTWGYADHIINLDLDSSHHNSAAAAVPFLGTVLHGHVQFAGMPLNEESNIEYAILKALENGAGFNFLLSYQNTTYLKEDIFLSQNYSVRYDIWRDDVISYYNELNAQLRDLQTKVIIGHGFIDSIAERVLDLAEMEAKMDNELKAALDKLNASHEVDRLNTITTLSEVRVVVDNILAGDGEFEILDAALSDMQAAYTSMMENYTKLVELVDGFNTFFEAQLEEAAREDATDEEIDAAIDAIGAKLEEVKTSAENVMKASASFRVANAKANNAYNALPKQTQLDEALAVVNSTNLISDEIKAMYREEIELAATALADYLAIVDPAMSTLKADFDANSAIYSDDEEGSAILLAVDLKDSIKVPSDHAEKKAIESAIKDVKINKNDLNKLGVVEIETPTTSDPANKPGASTNTTVDEYTVDKNSVVAVTYGDRVLNAARNYETTAYKTFLLNYNSYAVRLVYNGVLYTIPASGYVAVYH